MSEQQPNEAVPAKQAGEVPWWRNDPWLGRHLFVENRNKNPELTTPYEGKYVAWFPDGSGVRDADEDSSALYERIKASGDNPTWFTYEYIEQPGTRI